MEQQGVENRSCAKYQDAPQEGSENRTVNLPARFADMQDAGESRLHENGIPIPQRLPQPELHKPAEKELPTEIEQQVRKSMVKERCGRNAGFLVQRIFRKKVR